MNDPTQIEELLDRWEEHREAGQDLTVEELCADHVLESASVINTEWIWASAAHHQTRNTSTIINGIFGA